ncbi:MAG TPA: histone deacetylase [Chloroflexia bacterium]|nr:histone deacetylase [Chloroflexia bacterium]
MPSLLYFRMHPTPDSTPRHALFYHPAFLEHDTGPHPENAARLRGILQALGRNGISEDDLTLPGPADIDLLCSVHDPRYVAAIEQASEAGGLYWDYDTIISRGSYRAALLAAGAATAAVDGAIQGAQAPFAIVRPPGHHAVRSSAMGFCIFNNVAVAAQHAVQKHGLERVMIIDWDVHHGNGTQDLFYNRPDVFFLSTHQSPFYPGTGSLDETGSGKGEGFTLNVPLPSGVDDAGYTQVFEEIVAPAARRYSPQLIIISAGYDAHVMDPIGGMAITTSGFYSLARFIRMLSDNIESCAGRVAAVLEGGYNVEALSASVVASIAGLSDGAGELIQHEEPEQVMSGTNPRGRSRDITPVISSVKQIHRL